MDVVEQELVAQDGTWKAEIFRRPDGTYGFRALRWDPKRMPGASVLRNIGL
jgi:hypothetical protein